MSDTLCNKISGGKTTCIGSKFSSLPDNIVTAMNEIAPLPGVDKAILLPDVHLKEKYVKAGYKISVPSSMVISTEPDSLYPQFRSRGIGCGMVLVGTGLIVDDLAKEITELLRKLPLYLTSRPLRQQGQSLRSFVMSESDVIQMCLRGAPWVCQQFDLPLDNTRNFWGGGSFFSKAEIHDFSWKGFTTGWREGQAIDGRRIGLDLTGNHFLEAQYVRETPSTSDKPCLRKGELVFLYHGSCNGLEWTLDKEIVGRVIKRSTFGRLSPDEWEYDLIFRAIKLLLNWSAAARCLVIVRLWNLLKTLLPGVSLDNFGCVSEAPHNTIFTESVNGETRIVYRHNAIPIKPGQPAIVSGRYDHPSYVFVPGESPERSLNTLDHGIGAIIDRNSSVDTLANHSSQRVDKQYYRGLALGSRKQQTRIIDPVVTEPLFCKPYERTGLVEQGHYVMYPLATLKRKAISPRRVLMNLVKR